MVIEYPVLASFRLCFILLLPMHRGLKDLDWRFSFPQILWCGDQQVQVAITIPQEETVLQMMGHQGDLSFTPSKMTWVDQSSLYQSYLFPFIPLCCWTTLEQMFSSQRRFVFCHEAVQMLRLRLIYQLDLVCNGQDSGTAIKSIWRHYIYLTTWKSCHFMLFLRSKCSLIFFPCFKLELILLRCVPQTGFWHPAHYVTHAKKKK